MRGERAPRTGIEYVDNLDYSVDSQHQQLFYDSVRKFLPAIEYDDLAPEMAGIRPKLQEPGGEIRDFVISLQSEQFTYRSACVAIQSAPLC